MGVPDCLEDARTRSDTEGYSHPMDSCVNVELCISAAAMLSTFLMLKLFSISNQSIRDKREWRR